MPKYIDADKIEWHTLYFNGGKQEITYKDEIDALPAKDVAPVVHGKWIVNNCIQDSFGITCSACNFKWRNRRYMQYQRYCPKCGAKMDKEELE